MSESCNFPSWVCCIHVSLSPRTRRDTQYSAAGKKRALSARPLLMPKGFVISPSYMQDPCWEAIVRDPDHPHDFLRDPVVLQDFPEHLSIHGIKGLFKFYEEQMYPSVPFQGLPHDNPQSGSLVTAGSLFAKSCLLIPKSVTKRLLHCL